MGSSTINETFMYSSVFIIRTYSHLEDGFGNALMEISVSSLLKSMQIFF